MGWNGSNVSGPRAVSKPKADKPRKLSGLVAGLFVVAGATCAWFWLQKAPVGTTSHPKANSSVLIAEANPAPAAKAQAGIPLGVSKAKPVEEPITPETVKPYWDTNKWEIQSGYLVPKGARLVKSYLTNKVERTFKYSTDETILAYLYPQKDGALPPLQPIMGRSDEFFLKSLKDPVIINDDDTDEIRAQKELVIVARAQIKERMDAGEKFSDILQDNYRLMQENQKIRRDAQAELNKIYREGDLEGAKKYKRVIDVALQQMGIDGLKDPKDNPKNRKREKQ